ncbi:cytochrome P450 [Neobacillus niacini]|uniref:cytochrome P450 n=1 Tax=Neobacillus niacini TaxID=86668 RepID=UPI002FFF584D
MKQLRSQCPVSQIADKMWYFANYEDTEKAFPDFKTFSNAGGFAVSEKGKNIDESRTTLIQMDPPRHTKMRKFFLATLNAKSYRNSSEFIIQSTRDLIKEIAPKEKVDLMSEMLTMIPGNAFCHISGIPVKDQRQFCNWVDDLLLLADKQGVNTADIFAQDDNLPEPAVLMLDYIQSLITERRNSLNPPDDIITKMIQYEDKEDGKTFSDKEIQYHVRFLLFGGYETTKSLLSNLFHELISSQELYQRVRNDRSLVSLAVEESLRTSSPFKMIMRTVTKDIEVKGVNIPKGDRIVLGIQSANRDESVYGEDSETFSLDRENPPGHLAFGKGPHRCIGADLARIEAQIVLNEFLDAFPEVSLDPDSPAEKSSIYWQNGFKTLPIIFPARNK